MADPKRKERIEAATREFVSRDEPRRIGALSLGGRKISGSRYSLLRSVALKSSVNLWERLLSRELRSEQEVRGLSVTLEKYWQDNVEGVSGSLFVSDREVRSELEFASFFLDGVLELKKDIAAPGWESWEIIYVIGLRMVDAAIKNFDKGRMEIGAFLLTESVHAQAFGDSLGEGQEHRNKEHLVEITEQLYRDKMREFAIRDGFKDRQKKIASYQRTDALQKLVLKFLSEKKDGTWKQLARYLENDRNNSESIVHTVSFDNDLIEWEDDRGRIKKSSLQSTLANRLTRARRTTRKT